MPALPRFAIDLLQRFGSTRVGRELETQAFLGVARGAAREFSRVDGVTGVYLTGSWVSPRAAAPGYSDIDLILAVEVPTLSDELRLREALHRTQRRWNTFAPIFKHVDYMERRDFEMLRRGGNIFWVDADDRFVSLAGRSELEPGRRIHCHVSTERTISALKRWARVSQVLIDPTFVRPEVITRRAAARLLAGVIADCLRVSPLDPTDDLIALGRRHIGALASFSPPSGSTPTTKFALAHATAALRVVDETCRRHAAESLATAAPTTQPAPSVASTPVSFVPDRFDASVRRAGFAGGVVATLPPPHDPAVAFVLTDDDAATSVERLHRCWRDLDLGDYAGRTLRPALLTREAWATSRLLYPAPETGEALARCDTVWGRPPSLSDTERMQIGVGRLLDLFVRPRGRAFRVDRRPDVALRALAEDVFHAAPKMRAYRTGVTLETLPDLPAKLDEAELLGQLRSFLDEERPVIARALGIETNQPARRF